MVGGNQQELGNSWLIHSGCHPSRVAQTLVRPSPVLGKLGSTVNEREAFVKEKAIGYLVAMLQPDVLHPSRSPGAGLPAGWVAARWRSQWVASVVLGAFASSAHIIARLSVVQCVFCFFARFPSLLVCARADCGPKNLNGLEA